MVCLFSRNLLYFCVCMLVCMNMLACVGMCNQFQKNRERLKMLIKSTEAMSRVKQFSKKSFCTASVQLFLDLCSSCKWSGIISKNSILTTRVHSVIV